MIRNIEINKPVNQETINFIQFLRREFGTNKQTPASALFGFDKISDRQAGVARAAKDKSRFFNSKLEKNDAHPIASGSKLQIVLDEYIKEAGGKPSPFIDGELIKKWQSATDRQKKEIISSFIKKHKPQKIDWQQIDFGKISSRQLSHWQAVLAFSLVFAVFLTSLLATSNPGLINMIGEKETRIVNRLMGIKSPEEKIVLVNDLAREELSRFIRENSKKLRAPIHRDRKTFSFEASEVRGKVAGAFEEKPVSLPADDLSLAEKVFRLMDKLADKQIEISIKLGGKINRIFE